MNVFDTAVAAIVVLMGFSLFCGIMLASVIIRDVYKITTETKKEKYRNG